jgi:hypothetical protein
MPSYLMRNPYMSYGMVKHIVDSSANIDWNAIIHNPLNRVDEEAAARWERIYLAAQTSLAPVLIAPIMQLVCAYMWREGPQLLQFQD